MIICKKCEEGHCDDCTANALIDKGRGVYIEGFTEDDAKEHCRCLAADHEKEEIPKLKPWSEEDVKKLDKLSNPEEEREREKKREILEKKIYEFDYKPEPKPTESLDDYVKRSSREYKIKTEIREEILAKNSQLSPKQVDEQVEIKFKKVKEGLCPHSVSGECSQCLKKTELLLD